MIIMELLLSHDGDVELASLGSHAALPCFYQCRRPYMSQDAIESDVPCHVFRRRVSVYASQACSLPQEVLILVHSLDLSPIRSLLPLL